MDTKELLKKVKNENIKMVDLRFTDLPGSTHHISIPIKYLTEDLFTDGVGFDGSSVRGFQSIENSDMALPASDLKGYPFFGGVGFNDFLSNSTIL